MIDLIITKRASCYVIGGLVLEQNPSSVVLASEIPLPVTGGRQKVKCNVALPMSVSAKIRLLPGTYIVAMVKPDMTLDMMWSGAEFPVEELDLCAFYIKTGGEIRLNETKEEKEKTVFLGEVVKEKEIKNGWQLVHIRLFNGEIKALVAFEKISLTVGRKHAFLVGKASANSKGNLFYPIEKEGETA